MAIRTASQSGIRRRQRSTLPGVLVLGVAILAAAVIIGRGGNNAPAPAVAPTVVAEFDTIAIPVPVEPVAVGTKIKDVRFRTIQFPKRQLPDGALTSLNGVSEAVVVAPLPANLPLFRANLSLTAQSANPVTERIPPGMRAMTIRVDATTAVEGWAGSGTIVDVLLVDKDRTVVVAEMVKVLSAERSVTPVEGVGSPNVPTTVTLLVTQEQCLAINTAIPQGRIAFALRSTRDEEAWDNTVYSSDRLKGGASTKQARSVVNGFVAIDGERKFALSNGKWVETQSVPEGFFVAGRPIEKAAPEVVSTNKVIE